MKKYLVGTLLGGVILFFLGYLTYAVLMPNRMFDGAAAAAASKAAPTVPAIFIAELLFGFLLTHILAKSGAITKIGSAVMTGAVVGGAIALGYSLLILADTRLMTRQGVLFVAVTWAIRWGIAGAVLSLAAGKGKSSSA